MVIMAALLAACAATGDDYIPGVRPAVEMHAILGQLTIGESDLLGPDANQNGVRDEIDKTIRTTFTDASARKAATRFAVSISRAMMVGLNGIAPSEEQKQEYVVAMVCLDSMKQGASDMLLAETVRTKNRAAAMTQWRKRVGMLHPVSSGANCELAS